MNTGQGKEAWVGFGLSGYLASMLPTCQPEQFKLLLIASVLLAILSGVQRTIVKYMSWRYGIKESNDVK